MPNCYYYDEQGNRCNCYVNKNLNELLAENARLREELEAAKHDLQVFSCGAVGLNAENAKLRELVEQMHRYMADTVEHNGYVIQTTGYTMLGSRVKECEEAMFQLGIEVD